MRVRAGRAGAGAAAAGALVVALAGWGMVRTERPPAYAHPTLFDGHGWLALSLPEKELLVQGFLLGAAAEQALGDEVVAPPAGGPPAGEEARALAQRIAELRAAQSLRVALAPRLLARRLDEFYWWRNNRDIPVAGALAEVNGSLGGERFPDGPGR